MSLIARALGRVQRPFGREGATNHVSVGPFCHTAAALREAGLRRWSGPFDWIFSTPAMVLHCLSDDFATLLDPARLESVPAEQLSGGATRQCRHRFYEESYGVPILFNHHDPAGSAADYAWLQRAVRRFRETLGTPSANVFWLMGEPEWPTADVAALAGRLAAGPGRSSLVIVRFRQDPEHPGWDRRLLGEEPCPILSVELRTRTRSNGVRFQSREDDARIKAALLDTATHLARP